MWDRNSSLDRENGLVINYRPKHLCVWCYLEVKGRLLERATKGGFWESLKFLVIAGHEKFQLDNLLETVRKVSSVYLCGAGKRVLLPLFPLQLGFWS
jgi:hypothetical protein